MFFKVRQELCRVLYMGTVNKGEPVIEEGDVGLCMYILLSGQVLGNVYFLAVHSHNFELPRFM